MNPIKEREGAETVEAWSKDGTRRVHRYQIRSIVNHPTRGRIGMCGTVRVGFTWSTRCWFWDDKAFGGYVNGPIDVVGR